MSKTVVVRVSDFAEIPGARYIKDGDNSAEEFFLKVLKKIADQTLLESSFDNLLIDLDNTRGYPSSFISELSKLCSINYKKAKKVKQRLSIKSDEDPGLEERFWSGFKQKYS